MSPAAKKSLRCSCCGMEVTEAANGLCVDCSEGRHMVHCGKGEPAKAEAPPATEAAPAAAPATPAQVVEEKKPNGDAPATQAVVKAEDAKPRRTIAAGDRGLILTNIEDMYRFSNAVVRAGLAPKGLDSPEAVMVAIQFGAEVGLTPMQSLQNVASVNGRPSLFGDAPLGIVEASGLLEECDSWFEHQGKRLEGGQHPDKMDESTTAFFMAKRRGRSAQVRSFSVADAKRANLWGKTGRNGEPSPWVTYPQRMLMARARGFCLRDVFPDKLKGFRDEHETADIIDVTPETPTIDMPKRASETEAAAS